LRRRTTRPRIDTRAKEIYDAPRRSTRLVLRWRVTTSSAVSASSPTTIVAVSQMRWVNAQVSLTASRNAPG